MHTVGARSGQSLIRRGSTSRAADDRIAALHEARHACFATMKGWSVREAVLHRIGARADEQGHVLLHDAHGERDADPHGFVMFLLAARAAERRATGTISPRCSDDLLHARRLCAALLNQGDLTSASVETRMADAQTLADAAIQDADLWRWIGRVAQELTWRRRVTGRQIAEVRREDR